jgi:hypothetical protein
MEAATQVRTDSPPEGVSARRRRRGKLRLLTRANLDRRTKAAQAFDEIASGIAKDIAPGGEDQLSCVQKHLIEAFAGVALHVNDLNARLLIGEPVDVLVHSNVISTMVRLASRIGIDRVAKDISPSLAEYLAETESGAADVG